MQLNSGGGPNLPPKIDPQPQAPKPGDPGFHCFPIPGDGTGIGGAVEKAASLAADKAAVKADQNSIKADQSTIAKDRLALTTAEDAAQKSGALYFIDPTLKEKLQLQKDQAQLSKDQGKLQSDEIKVIVDEFLGKFPPEPKFPAPPGGVHPIPIGPEPMYGLSIPPIGINPKPVTPFPIEPLYGAALPPGGLDPKAGLPIGLGGDKALPGQGTDWFN